MCKIISYADDLAVTSAGKKKENVLRKAQCGLDLMSEACCRVKLKISAGKLKAMAMKLNF